MTIEARVEKHSKYKQYPELVTMVLKYPRYIHCFHKDTEFLSQIGDEMPEWRKYDTIVALQAKVAQYDEGVVSFVHYTNHIKRKASKLVVHKRKQFEMAVTPEHRMYSLRRTTGNVFLPHTDTAQEWIGDYSAHRRIPQAGSLVVSQRTSTLSPEEAMLIAYYVADGHQPKTGHLIHFHFKKECKIQRMFSLLNALGIEYTTTEDGDTVVIRTPTPSWVADCYTESGEKKYPECVWNLSKKAFDSFLQGVLESDGYEAGSTINTTSITCAEQLQILFALNNRAMNIRYYGQGDYKRLYKQTIQDTNYVSFRADKDVFTEEEYNDDVVCFSVPSSYLLVRYNTFVFVSGNCELLTHRMFSRNSSSSRATPVKTLLNNIKKDPATPIVWGSNKSGMQAGEELTGWRLAAAKLTWFLACRFAVFFSGILHKVGLHKQHANRITEPFQHINTIVTSTEWDNFFKLRNHPDAQPEIQCLAKAIQEVIYSSEPEVLKYGQWHLPFITEEEQSKYCLADLKKASAARCARIAYARHGSSDVDITNDVSLYTRLAGSDPKHLSPLEHIALPCKSSKNNFRYWKQLRQEVE